MNRNNNVVIILLIIIVILLAFLAFKPKDTVSVSNQNGSNISPTLTQSEAETLVIKNWGGAQAGEGMSFTVSTAKNNNGTYTIDAIYSGGDDSVGATRREGVATYQNGIWVLSSPIVTQSCVSGRGHIEFNTNPCN